MKNLKRLLGALALLTVLAASAWAAPKNVTLVLLRHGESEWNLEDRFTGWSDVRLTRKGVKGAFNAGIAMKNADLTFDVVHTSLLSRAIATAWLAMSALDCRWLPVEKFWRLNERCYGDLEGKTRTEVAEAVGKEQVDIWRRSYDVPPPALAYDDPRSPVHDPRYACIDRRFIPQAESLKDVIAREAPYWSDTLAPTLRAGMNVLVVGHSTALRALSSWVEPNLTPEELRKLEIPNSTPVVYNLEITDDGFNVVSREVMKVEDIPLPPPPEADKPAEKPAEAPAPAAGK